MRILVLTLAVLGFSTVSAFAADEFGARFGEDTPAALSDPLEPDPALSLQNIEPAAGDAAETSDPLMTENSAKENSEETDVETPEIDL